MVNILREIFREKNYWEYGLKSEVEKRNQSGRKYGLCPFILLGGPEYSIILLDIGQVLSTQSIQ